MDLPRSPPEHALNRDACCDTIVRIYNRALDTLGDALTLPDSNCAQFLPSLFDVISTHYLAQSVRRLLAVLTIDHWHGAVTRHWKLCGQQH